MNEAASVTVVVRIEEGKLRGCGVAKFRTPAPTNKLSRKWQSALRRSRAMAINTLLLDAVQRKDEEGHQQNLFG